MSDRADVLVIGGGLAGPAAAIVLAQAGRRVTLLEREREPKHKVCGEFLSAEALHLLGSLGVSPAALGAVPVHGVRFCSARHVSSAQLPFTAMSLTRRRLDPALLCVAEAAGVHVVRGAAVQSLVRDRDGWRADVGGGATFSARDAVLATGKHELRGFVRPAGPQGDLVGMKMYLRLAPAQAAALAGHVELLLYPGGYAGLQPVEEGVDNLCGLVQRKLLAKLSGWDGLLALMRESNSHAQDRLAGAEPLLAKPLRLPRFLTALCAGWPLASDCGPWAIRQR